MKDQPRTAPIEDRKSNTKSGAVVERRSSRRKAFVAEAQVIEIASGSRVIARSGDLDLHGCYIDTLNPFAVGTLVRIQLKNAGALVEVKGNVVYRSPGLGMGVVFHDLTPATETILKDWLNDPGCKEDDFRAFLPSLRLESLNSNETAVLQRVTDLIQTLLRKGILSQTEVAIILKQDTDI